MSKENPSSQPSSLSESVSIPKERTPDRTKTLENDFLSSAKEGILVSGQRGPLAHLSFVKKSSIEDKTTFIEQVMENFLLEGTTHDPLFLTQKEQIEQSYHSVGLPITDRLSYLKQFKQTKENTISKIFHSFLDRFHVDLSTISSGLKHLYPKQSHAPRHTTY